MNPDTQRLELLPELGSSIQGEGWRGVDTERGKDWATFYPGKAVIIDGLDFEVRRVTTDRLILRSYGEVSFKKGEKIEVAGFRFRVTYAKGEVLQLEVVTQPPANPSDITGEIERLKQERLEAEQ